jgi:hypothetical protein
MAARVGHGTHGRRVAAREHYRTHIESTRTSDDRGIEGPTRADSRHLLGPTPRDHDARKPTSSTRSRINTAHAAGSRNVRSQRRDREPRGRVVMNTRVGA